MIILDEPTSAQDGQSDYNIMKALKKISSDIPIVYISHTKDTLRFADEIIRLDDGQLIPS